MKKLPFKSNAFDQLHKEIKGCSLDWSAKALITHVINWQIKTNKKTGQHCICTESNATIARQLGMSPSTLSKLITRLNRETTFFRSEKISKQRTDGYFNSTKKNVDIPKLLQWLELEANWWLDRYEKELTETDVNVMTHEVATVDEKSGELTKSTCKVEQMHQSSLIRQQMHTEENTNDAKTISCEVFGDDFDWSSVPALSNNELSVEVMPMIEAPVEVVTPLLKEKATEEEAGNFFFQLLENDNDLLSNVMNGTDEQADMLIRIALMNHIKLGPQVKVVYNEWVNDFVRSELPRLREFIEQFHHKQSA
jgi:hypothetical protein